MALPARARGRGGASAPGPCSHTGLLKRADGEGARRYIMVSTETGHLERDTASIREKSAKKPGFSGPGACVSAVYLAATLAQLQSAHALPLQRGLYRIRGFPDGTCHRDHWSRKGAHTTGPEESRNHAARLVGTGTAQLV